MDDALTLTRETQDREVATRAAGEDRTMGVEELRRNAECDTVKTGDPHRAHRATEGRFRST